MPDYAGAMDVHLMPVTTKAGRETALRRALYDNGLDVFSFGVMGENLDDIGHSMANFCRLKWPDLNPQLVVDVGCTIGHNTVP